MDDGSGSVLVGPEILTSHKQVSTSGGYRKSEWTPIEGEPIYVIGEHFTLGGPNAVLDKNADLATLLAEWKNRQNRPASALRHRSRRRDQPGKWDHARKARRAKSTAPIPRFV